MNPNPKPVIQNFLSLLALTLTLLVGLAAPAAYADYGNGADGALTVSATLVLDTDMRGGRSYPDAVAHTVAALGAQSVTTAATPNGIAVGDEVLLINLQGAPSAYDNVGNYETFRVASVDGSTLQLTSPITKTYGQTANTDLTGQKIVVQRVPNYTDVTVESAGILTASAWNGSQGGVLFFRAAGMLYVADGGSVDMSAKGYRGGPDYSAADVDGYPGESYAGQAPARSVNANFGGGGGGGHDWWIAGNCGGGGSYGTLGEVGDHLGSNAGDRPTSYIGGSGGLVYGHQSLSNIFLGSGGGSGGQDGDNGSGDYLPGPSGGVGGGAVFVACSECVLNGPLSSRGGSGITPYNNSERGGSGGGSGGTILLQSADIIAVSSFYAIGGEGTEDTSNRGLFGGNGGSGRILINAQTINGVSASSMDGLELIQAHVVPCPGTIFHVPSIVAGTSDDATPVDVTLTAVGGDGSETFEIVEQPALGSVGIVTNVLTYTPEAGYEGIVRFQYRARIGDTLSLPGWIEMWQGMSHTEGFETGDFSSQPWQHSGNANWGVQSGTVHGGSFAAQAPQSIGDNQASYMEFEIATPAGGTVSFWFSVSSERNYDYLRFYVDGVNLAAWSGGVGWTQYSATLAPGSHILKWGYTKDGSVSSGSDTAWVDDIVVDGVPPIYIQNLAPDTLTAEGATVAITGYGFGESGTLRIGGEVVTPASWSPTSIVCQVNGVEPGPLDVEVESGGSIDRWAGGLLVVGGGGEPSPEIAVEQPLGSGIYDGGTHDFGAVTVGDSTQLVFTIRNTGTADLTGISVSKDGADAERFSLLSVPEGTIVPGGSSSFTVAFAPVGSRMHQAAIHIANNDANENPFDINLTGYGVVGALPDLTSSLRILDTSGNEVSNPFVGETVNLEFTVSNDGDAATAEAIEVRVFEGAAPTDLTSYNLGSYIVAASTTLAEAIPAGGSRTVLLPWPIDGGDRISTLTAVAEFAANRVVSQANHDTPASTPLPVAETSFANNSAARSVQIGTPAPGDYGITVAATAPENPQSGVAYPLGGTATYDWGDNNPVLGAEVTVKLDGNTVGTDRTTSPNGNWSVNLPGMTSGGHTVVVTVSDGGVTGTKSLVLTVAAGALTTDLRVKQIGYESGTYQTSGETAWAATGSAVVLKALIRNDGNTAAGSFSVAFKAPEGSTIATANVPGLDAFSETWVPAPSAWTTSATGAQTVTVVADSDTAIVENNEDNNSRSATVNVSSALPDLVVADLTWPATPKQGETVTVTALLRNDGPATLASSTPFDVLFTLADSVTDTAKVTLAADLAFGATTTAQVTLPTTGLGIGGLSLTATVDSGTSVNEVSESNNTRTETLTIATAQPDLVVSDLVWSPASPKAGDSVTVTATIRNSGGGALASGTSFSVDFALGGTTSVGHTLSGDLNPGGTVSVSTTWTAVTGNQPVTTTADSTNAVTEDFETNNSRSATIPVRAALPDLRPWTLQFGWQSVSGLSFSPANPTAGDAVTITLQVWNTGTVDVPAGNYEVAFTADGTPIATETLALSAPLAPGASTTLSTTWTASGSGEVTLAATVDSTTALTEEDEGNNATTKALTVYPASAGVSVSGLVPSLWQPFPNTPITLTATVVNGGGQPSAGNHLVTFYLGDPANGGQQIGSATVADPLAAKGGSATATLNWTTPENPQTVAIYAVCEGTQRTVNVIVTNTPAPDLALYSSDIHISNPLPAGGSSVSLSATVRNLVGGESDVEVVFEYNTAGLWLPLGQPVIVYDLAATETETVNASQTLPVTAYYYTVRVTLTPLAHTDANPSDNIATTSFRRADAPWANAGANQEVWTGQTVTLDGSASAHASSYKWTLSAEPQGSHAELASPASATPSFVPVVAGVYEVQLVVSTNGTASPADTVTITVLPGTPTDLTLIPATVAENAPADTVVGTLTGSGGSGSYSYALVTGSGDTDNAKFAITGDQLKVAGLLDYEVQTTAAIRVSVADVNSGNTYEEALTLTITDDTTEDGDNDGLTDAEEDAATTSRTNPDTDGDGLNDGAEVNTHGTNPKLADTDGDKFDDGVEVANAALGLDPKLNQAALHALSASVIRNSVTEQQAHDLYPEAAIRNIHVGKPLIGVTNGEVRLELQLQKSNDLQTWQPFGDPVEWIDTPADKAFYRLFME